MRTFTEWVKTNKNIITENQSLLDQMLNDLRQQLSRNPNMSDEVVSRIIATHMQQVINQFGEKAGEFFKAKAIELLRQFRHSQPFDVKIAPDEPATEIVRKYNAAFQRKIENRPDINDEEASRIIMAGMKEIGDKWGPKLAEKFKEAALVTLQNFRSYVTRFRQVGKKP